MTQAPPGNRKDKLLDCIVETPLAFTPEAFEELANKSTGVSFDDIRQRVFRIFDINQTIFLQESDAAIAPNIKSQQRREKRFYERLRRGFDRRQGKIIVAEGDSWFEFPQAIKDIIDHLNENERYNIYSIAYGGDWITNIIYEGKYIEKLSTLNPDVFMVSGGGNDMVGSDRLGLMACAEPIQDKKYPDAARYISKMQFLYGEQSGSTAAEHFKVLDKIQQYIKPAFYSFMTLLKLQYRLMFDGIHHKHPNIRIITQAYDYAIPSPDYHGFPISIRRYVNKKLGTGRWLYIPMMANGITDRHLQQALIRYMIDEFNDIFAELAISMPNVYHIDCRGTARNVADWYDELHLVSERFGIVAKAYEACIEDPSGVQKIFRARDYDS